jgi:hypothetical protein
MIISIWYGSTYPSQIKLWLPEFILIVIVFNSPFSLPFSPRLLPPPKKKKKASSSRSTEHLGHFSTKILLKIIPQSNREPIFPF